MIITLLILAWITIGMISIIYWWTDSLPVELEDMVIVLLAGSVLGLFSFILFALPLLIGQKWPKFNSDKVIFKQRESRYEKYTNNAWPGEDE